MQAGASAHPTMLTRISPYPCLSMQGEVVDEDASESSKSTARPQNLL